MPIYDPDPRSLQPILDKALEDLMGSDPQPLTPGITTGCMGVYTLSYTGTFPLYTDLGRRSGPDAKVILYVGACANLDIGKNRLKPHANSLREVADAGQSEMDYTNFLVRYVRMEHDIYIKVIEELFRRHFRPPWNHSTKTAPTAGITGLGNNKKAPSTKGDAAAAVADPDEFEDGLDYRGRKNGFASPFDHIHPGREYARELKRRSPEQVNLAVEAYLKRDALQKEERRTEEYAAHLWRADQDLGPKAEPAPKQPAPKQKPAADDIFFLFGEDDDGK